MSRALPKQFQKKILSWYRINGRHSLPWRRTRDPYHILVAEVMLQQTQVPRVLKFYPKFIRQFPTARKLAAASLGEVLKLWSGLGYNRRAKYLSEAAKQISRVHHGSVPTDQSILEELPGIGHYTAQAVICFSGGRCEPFLETNIRRVLLHFFFPRSKSVSDEKLLKVLDSLSLAKRDWYLALMDYGALELKQIANPNRRSRHYTKQSQFLGSKRFARGWIIRKLLDSKQGITVGKLFTGLRALHPYPFQTITQALHDLSNEGMVRYPQPLTLKSRCDIVPSR